MAFTKAPRRPSSGNLIVDDQRKINYALERNINMFELRYKKRQPFDQGYFGLDDIVVERIERPNSHDIKIDVRIERSTQIIFTPNEEGVLVCFIPDTPKNRRVLALMWYEADWIIARLIKPDGEIPGMHIQREIKAYADTLGVQAPEPISRTIRRGNAPAPAPKPQNMAAVEAIVHKRHASLIEALQKENGENYKNSTIYQAVIKKEIVLMASNLGIHEDGTKKAGPELGPKIENATDVSHETVATDVAGTPIRGRKKKAESLVE